jgi:hypothetical protein
MPTDQTRMVKPTDARPDVCDDLSAGALALSAYSTWVRSSASTTRSPRWPSPPAAELE